MFPKNVLLLGVGNTLLTDEGFGVAAVNYLQKSQTWPDNVRLLDGGTLGFTLMAEIQDCDFLVVLDVVLGGEKPGTIYLLEGDDLRRSASFRDSTHQTDLLDTLQACELIGKRPEAIAFGLQPFDCQSLHVGLSEGAARALPGFCQKVMDELRQRGLMPLA